MKRILLTLLLLALTAPVLAAPADQIGLCTTMSNLARAVASARDRGVPRSVLLRAMNSPGDREAQLLGRATVRVVFENPLLSPEQLATGTLAGCLQAADDVAVRGH